MKRSKLDKIDLNILKNIQSNGRITNVNLAKRAGISAPPCLRRVRALEQSGYIQGYSAHINSEMLGYNVTSFVSVNLVSQAEEHLKKFEEYIASHDVVRECHIVSGDVDFLLRVVAKDWNAYQAFVTENLTSAPNVKSVKSSLSIRTTKNEAGIPIELS